MGKGLVERFSYALPAGGLQLLRPCWPIGKLNITTKRPHGPPCISVDSCSQLNSITLLGEGAQAEVHPDGRERAQAGPCRRYWGPPGKNHPQARVTACSTWPLPLFCSSVL